MFWQCYNQLLTTSLTHVQNFLGIISALTELIACNSEAFWYAIRSKDSFEGSCEKCSRVFIRKRRV